MNKRLSAFYLVISIIGIITAIPVLGSVVDVFKILTFVLLGLSLYVLVKQPKGTVNRNGAILMIISCALSLIGWLIIMGSVGGMNVSDISSNDSYEASKALGGMLGGSLLAMLFSLPAWILKIISIVFTFKASSELKKLD